MDVIPLTAGQRHAVSALLDAGRIERVPADENRASAFLRKASIKRADIPNAVHPENRFDLAYGACHDLGEALLAAYGHRTRSGAGQHEALGQFLTAIFDSPPGDQAARNFDRLRRIRNAQDYRAQPVGEADAKLAADAAEALSIGAGEKGAAL